ncbi:MAG TPA: sugar transferase [Solirubrobacteraceae bacterium]|nr:sugar transferase [Solirubrobacteraceae bacterium]
MGLVRVAIAIAVGASATLAVLFALGANLGVGGAIGLGVLLAVLCLLSFIWNAAERAAMRQRYRAQAFVWQGIAVEADAIAHFNVRRWSGRVSDNELPPFVERTVMHELEEGVRKQRFIILKGERPCGKSRLVYEALTDRARNIGTNRKIFVSERALSATPAEDPLIQLMKDPKGFDGAATPCVLLLRDCAKRLASGAITGDFMRRWLDREKLAVVIATFSPADLERIKELDPDELERLEQQACVISLSPQLVGAEMDAAERIFPTLDRYAREWLPAYLCSAVPLREKFTESLQGRHAFGNAIVRAVVDWRRAGVDRPAPIDYLRSIAPSDPSNTSFDAELAWACEPVRAAMSLIREEEDGYVPDRIVLDMIDEHYGRRLHNSVGLQILACLLAEHASGRAAGETVDDLLGLALGITERGDRTFGEEVLTHAEQLAGPADRGRVVQHRGAISTPGSPQALVSSQVKDGSKLRLSERELLVDPPQGAQLPSRFIAWIYSRIVGRSVARISVLFAADALSVSLGFVAGLSARALVDQSELMTMLASGLRWLPLWIVGGIFVLVRLRLYRQDARRARLSPILTVSAILGFVGILATSTENPSVGAVPQVAVGVVLGATLCYWLRVLYDRVSSNWVRQHGLQAQTLIVGSESQALAAERGLSELTRPTEIVGFVTIDGRVTSERSLGTTRSLITICRNYNIGRIVIVDDTLTPDERQGIADICHEARLGVEALPSLADIRTGDTEFVVGQSIVLLRLRPLRPSGLAFFAKRLLDVVLASTAILLLIIAWLPIVILLKLDGGPVLLRHKRRGIAGRIFTMYKFRTTSRVNVGDHNDGNTPSGDHHWFGRFLKGRGLDEIPQLLNVIIGDMSLVGPRPLHATDDSFLSDDALFRYVVRPGVTGPWLVCRRTRLTYSELAALDVAYLRHWTLITDLDILAKTLRLMVRGREEYPALSARHQDGVDGLGPVVEEGTSP